MSRTTIPSRRRFLRHSAELGLLATLSASFAGQVLAAGKPGAAGSISRIKGQVFVNGRPATPSTTIPPNAEVRTGSRSMVAFAVGGDAHVLKANTAIKVSGSSGFTDQLRVLSGQILSAWGKRPSGREAQLLTTTATMGIRGTVTYYDNGKFSLLEGSVEYSYTDASGNPQRLTLARDESGKAVSMDAEGKRIDWLPPVSREEAAALQGAIMSAISEGATGLSGNNPSIDRLTEAQGILDELVGGTLSGTPSSDTPPMTGGSGSGSPQ